MFSDATLVHPDFDTSAYLTHVLHLPSSELEQARLARCAEAVQSQLSAIVAEHHEPLLQKVDVIANAQVGLDKIQSSVSVLNSSTGRLRHTIAEPAALVATKVTQLSNVMQTLEIVRNVQRFLILAQRLDDVGATDPPRAAKALREIEELMESADLAGIEVVDKRLDAVSKISARVRTKAHELLKTGLQQQRHNDIGSALQCFYSFDSVAKVVSGTVLEQKRDTQRIIVQKLDVQAIAAAIDSSANGKTSEGARTREVVLGCIERVLGDVLQSVGTVALLWRVLQRKRDPITQELIMASMPDDMHCLEDYWQSVSGQLADNIVKLTRRNNLHVMFVAEFPRFYHILKTFVMSLSDFFSLLRRDMKKDLGALWLRTVTKEVLDHFTSHSLERQMERATALTNKLQSITPPPGGDSAVNVERDPRQHTGVPPAANALDAKGLMKAIQQEVASNQQDTDVLLIVLRNAKTTLDAVLKRLTEHRDRNQPRPLTSITNGCSKSQLLHVCIANCATSIACELDVLIGLLPTSAILDDQVQVLRAHIAAFHAIAAGVQRSIVSLGRAALLNVLAAPASKIVGESVAEKLSTFLNRFAFLLDASTAGLEDALRDLGEAVLRRALFAAVFVRPFDAAAQAVVAGYLAKVHDALSAVQVNGRALVSLRPVKVLLRLQAAPLDEAPLAAASSLDPLVRALQLLQRVPQTAVPSPHVALNKTAEQLLVDLDDASGWSLCWDAVQRLMTNFETSSGVVEDQLRNRVIAAFCAIAQSRK